jgi:hypothetical protein
MKAEIKHETHPRGPSFVSLLSGWVQQGVQSFFATQRILLDLAMRQNATVMNVVRERVADARHSSTAMLTELAGEGMSNFIEAQQVLLNLAQQQNEIVTTGVRERIGGSAPAVAMADLFRRSIKTFVEMQHEFLKIANKQTHTWLEAAKHGGPYKADRFVDLAREGMENFVHAQKRFLDVIAEETAKATGNGKHVKEIKKIKKTELAELARQATESFIDAQKKLFDVAGRQVNVNLKAASRTIDIVKPFPVGPLAELTREGVKSFVDAQKALIDVTTKRGIGHKPASKTHRAKKPVRHVRVETAKAAHTAA